MSQAKGIGRSDTGPGRKTSFRLGIRGRLLGAFAATASLTLVASGVALLSYASIDDSFRRIAQDSVPAMSEALVLARQGAEFSGLTGSLVAAKDQAALEAGVARLADKRLEMRASLQAIGASAIGGDSTARLDANLGALGATAERLAASIARRLDLAARRKALVAGAQAAHQALGEKIAPLVDSVGFDLLVGLQAIDDKGGAAAAAAKLADGEAASVQSLGVLRADANLTIGLLTEASLVGDAAFLTPLRDRLGASAERAKKAAADLAAVPDAQPLRPALETLLSFAGGRQDILDLRRRQLEEMDEEQRIVGASQVQAAALAADVQDLVKRAQALSAAATASADAAIRRSRAALIGLGLFSVAASLAIGWGYVGRGILARLGRLHAAVVALAAGDLGATGSDPAMARNDEIGDMARALQVFRETGLDKARNETAAAADRRRAEEARTRSEAERAAALREQAEAVEALATGLARLSDGDLGFRLPDAFAASYAKLKVDFDASLGKLQHAMATIMANAHGIETGTRDISTAASELSTRTGQQAAGIEEAAAALQQITSTVRQTAEGAEHARKIASETKSEAGRSSVVVRSAVDAMTRIQKSSQEIGKIIDVINEIAFQTNLLALNAGVEAARAGDTGRGFAVVAAEVRALAQRSAAAGKEITALINASSAHVAEGSELVNTTGDALERIVAQVTEIDRAISAIAAGAAEQASGLRGVNAGLSNMDRMTQQNAAMVESTTAATHALMRDAEGLVGLVGRFRIAEGGAPRATSLRLAAE